MKTMRLTLALSLLMCLYSVAQTKKTEELFKKTATAVLQAFAKKDFKTLNKYVLKGTGTWIITRPGAIDNLKFCDSLQAECFSTYPYKDRLKKEKLKYGEAPRFSCGENKWTGHGFVADSSNRYHRVSDLMDFLSKNQMGDYKIAEQEAVRKLEDDSRKIVYTELAKKHGIVFYLTLINKKWYLTFIDTVASSCAG